MHVCGIFQGFKEEPKLSNQYFRVVGLLCDPDLEKAIHFTLFVEELTSFPKAGAVLCLHNMRLSEYERTFKLESGKRSYYSVENHNSHSYF